MIYGNAGCVHKTAKKVESNKGEQKRNFFSPRLLVGLAFFVVLLGHYFSLLFLDIALFLLINFLRKQGGHPGIILKPL